MEKTTTTKQNKQILYCRFPAPSRSLDAVVSPLSSFKVLRMHWLDCHYLYEWSKPIRSSSYSSTTACVQCYWRRVLYFFHPRQKFVKSREKTSQRMFASSRIWQSMVHFLPLWKCDSIPRGINGMNSPCFKASCMWIRISKDLVKHLTIKICDKIL